MLGTSFIEISSDEVDMEDLDTEEDVVRSKTDLPTGFSEVFIVITDAVLT